MAQDDAASLLVRFMMDENVPYAERRRCAEFLLTYENRKEVTVTLKKWEQDLDGLVVEDVVEAEIVDDEPRAIPPSHVLTEGDSEPSSVRGTRHRYPQGTR